MAPSAVTIELSISVVVPTFRRPLDLRRCLTAIGAQRRRPDEVIVVVRDVDTETWETLEAFDRSAIRLRTVTVHVPGQVRALNAGLREVSSDIIAITDDDAAPHDDWLERIATHFAANPELAGVGGRDYVHINGEPVAGDERVVGTIPRFRGHIGNHHLGYGEPREVDILKGVNGAYRVEAIRNIGFDERLRGSGAEVHWEISLGLALKRCGRKLLYDPRVAVDHFLAPRFDEDQRNAFNGTALSNMAFNEGFIRLEHLKPLERVLFLLWAVFLGTRALPGLAQLARFLPSQRAVALRKFAACMRGRFDAIAAVVRLN